ncbi:MAG: EutN/CcmL family microcompartment protein [Fuerstiella sp.]|jgi:ethanolamine utilization protein EutN|nr:EutN/CcmL family microcompartment protein [Fuerstiella sp.]
MRIMECIGKVTLSKWHSTLDGASWKVAVPLMHDGLCGKESGRTEPIVILDELGAGDGSLMAVSESAEAAAPFHPDTKPIDAYNAAILDNVNIAGT